HAYAERLPAAARHEWDKVAGRFEEIVFDQPLAHTAALIAGALGVGTIPVRIAEEARKAARATGAMGWLGGEDAEQADCNCRKQGKGFHPGAPIRFVISDHHHSGLRRP
ncbi:hypothetical protein EN851_34985, partial [Mesorhizobium sp. M8A.F.Ca.ET.208.01.1.1]|uniref:hypothetical protein n=1 Tax=Mesorhizobium sp. M8A.F.Ca.ET.208.01.1.1 TaxID=2563969 RepID=UPI001093FEE6